MSLRRDDQDPVLLWGGGLVVAFAAIVWLIFFASAVGGSGNSPSTARLPTATPTSAASPAATGTPEVEETPTATPGEERTYTVQPGDTLGAIADRFNVTVQAIVAANGIDNPSSLAVGQVLTIPPEGQ